MDRLIIGNITMPITRTLEVKSKLEAKEATMASGKIVRDIIGNRIELTASWEWLPADVLVSIVSLARQMEFVQIEYPDPVKGDTSGIFSIEIGSQKIFRFRNEKPYWYNIELTATAQEVL